jgi:glycerol dehydrogenase-like iron-containing ADH family enzyme
VERLTGRGFVHGWIVGLGIFLMTRLQENRAAWIAGLMDRLGLPYQRREMRLTREDVSSALLSLRRQTREDGRWWSVIDEREIGTPFVTAAIEDLRTA